MILNELGLKTMKEIVFNALDIFNISDEEAQKYYNSLPDDIKADFEKWGMGDSLTFEQACAWIRDEL